VHSTVIRNDQKQRSPTERTGRRTCDGVIANCRRDRTRVATSYAQVRCVKKWQERHKNSKPLQAAPHSMNIVLNLDNAATWQVVG
jgi:hypothetical protein